MWWSCLKMYIRAMAGEAGEAWMVRQQKDQFKALRCVSKA